MRQWPPKDPQEVQILTFNFAPDLNTGETLVTPSISISQIAGAVSDPGISAMLVGSPAISGATVQQTIAHGLANDAYQITAACTTSQGRTLANGAALTCQLAYLQ
ncbi:MAG: phage fiber-tail adaptor protein [Thiobacillus sp.]